MKIKYPYEVSIILSKIKQNGFIGYIVGGCVRDYLLGKKPSDWDITTNAKPSQLIKIFKEFKILTMGIKYGTITIIINNKNFEVTTLRVEKNYLDNRRPNEVTFTNCILQDLMRRDFTINSIAYNEDFGIIDPYNGRFDLENKVIKAVGNANKRFKEDSLRILRGIRFASQLNFKIDTDTYQAMKLNLDLIRNISKERIRDELIRIIKSEYLSIGMRIINDLGLLRVIFFNLKFIQTFNRDINLNYSINKLERTSKDFVIRLCTFVLDIIKDNHLKIDKSQDKIAEIILKELKFDNKTIKDVKVIIKEFYSSNLNTSVIDIKKVINRIGIENFYRLVELKKIIVNKKDLGKIDNIEKILEKIINNNEPLSLKDLDISGNDILKLGVKEGCLIGTILNNLLVRVYENPKLNNKHILLELAKSYIKKTD